MASQSLGVLKVIWQSSKMKIYINHLIFNDYLYPCNAYIPEKGNVKEGPNYHTIALISHASKEMLKILQARLQNTWAVNFQMFKLVLEKAKEPEIKLPTSAGS